MQSLTPNLNPELKTPLYRQLFNYIKDEIYDGRLVAGTKLPSLRALATSQKISITTVGLAYNQLMVEGYIEGREKSGYYVSFSAENGVEQTTYYPPTVRPLIFDKEVERPDYIDLSLFDFVKWKKCLNSVINDHSDMLITPASPRGEWGLRREIAHYLYMTRGLVCSPEQIIIAAGTQMTANLASTFLKRAGLRSLAYEDPGYLPSVNVFRDRGFEVFPVNIGEKGASLDEIRSIGPDVISVSPSNQFPLGMVMPVSERRALLNYAEESDCIIIEDDHAAELRYFGRPVPPLKSLDKADRVLYLGSFSSLLFTSLKISYMIIPERFKGVADEVMKSYNQTCSKTEQLALATYMEKGLLHTHVKKLRKLYSQKMEAAAACLTEAFGDAVEISSKDSGLNMVLEMKLGGTGENLGMMGESSERACEKLGSVGGCAGGTGVNSGSVGAGLESLTVNADAVEGVTVAKMEENSIEVICEAANRVGLNMLPLYDFSTTERYLNSNKVVFYYSAIPLAEMKRAVERLKSEVCGC